MAQADKPNTTNARRRQQRPASISQDELYAGMVYAAPGRQQPEGWFLAHNHVMHGKNTRNGVNGFRYFWIKDRSKWSACLCGWRPELGEHYSKRPEQKLLKRVPTA